MSLLVLVSTLGVLGCNAILGTDPKKKVADSAEDQACAGDALSCGEACVQVATNPTNCGACGVVCGAGQYCEAGTCVGFCAAGELDCAGECKLTSSDTLNCGACGAACPVGQYCDAGACSATCSGTLCTDAAATQQCVHLDSNNDHCGACGVACADGQACQGSECVEACPEGRLACGAGCVDVRTDAGNCGACGVVCEAGVACVEGACGGGTPVCAGGSCACTASQTDCNGTCVDVQTNLLHCGSCGAQCAPGQSCTAGACTCPAGGQLCAAGCTDVATDGANCGACGTVCSGGTTCQAGSCQCSAGLSVCDETCVDQKMDRNHCGGCGIVCEGYEDCVAGICKYDGDQCGGEARAINIGRVSLYQAVEADLFKDGVAVPKEQRSVDVIRGRDAMIRVFVTPQAGFAAHELSARIFVENDGDIQAYHHKKTVSGPSSQGSLDSTFQLQVPADVIRATTKYRIELVECGTLPTGTVGTVRFPTAAGTSAEFLARETGVIKVVFVPVSHGGRTPDISEATMGAYAREVEKLYPTVGVEWSVRGAIQSNQSGVQIDLGSTLDLVTDQRDSDGPADDVYYYGLIDPASTMSEYCGYGCTTGVGWVPDVDGWWSAGHRVAVGVGFGTRGVGTFAHELGHNHGRNHAPCGGASGSDQSYPHSGALIGTWGYDREAKQLLDPSNHKDFMSYCDPNWVSDYSFRAYTNRIAALNGAGGYQLEVQSLAPPSTWYRMVVTDSGAKWSSPVQGSGTPGNQPEVVLIYDQSGAVVSKANAYRITMSHTGGYMLYVPEPLDGWFAVGVPGGPLLAY